MLLYSAFAVVNNMSPMVKTITFFEKATKKKIRSRSIKPGEQVVEKFQFKADQFYYSVEEK